MTRLLTDIWRLLVFVAEAACAILFGVPLGLFIGLCGGLLIYFLVFRLLIQQLAAMWRKGRVRRLAAAAARGGSGIFF
ncbi:MAG TPA: hypothetical protein VKQ28_14645 [Candidatus Acidoferrum sp.]|nr:hypothetical protein [Candidatus Acidoferrum sp.]